MHFSPLSLITDTTTWTKDKEKQHFWNENIFMSLWILLLWLLLAHETHSPAWLWSEVKLSWWQTPGYTRNLTVEITSVILQWQIVSNYDHKSLLHCEMTVTPFEYNITLFVYRRFCCSNWSGDTQSEPWFRCQIAAPLSLRGAQRVKSLRKLRNLQLTDGNSWIFAVTGTDDQSGRPIFETGSPNANFRASPISECWSEHWLW